MWSLIGDVSGARPSPRRFVKSCRKGAVQRVWVAHAMFRPGRGVSWLLLGVCCGQFVGCLNDGAWDGQVASEGFCGSCGAVGTCCALA